MNKSMEKRVIKFSPPDISELEIAEVAEAMRSGWITTGPRTKLLERRLTAYFETGDNESDYSDNRFSNKTVCLNSATAAEELNLRVLGIGPGDEVIVPAYTYTATASAVKHCGADVVFVDCQKDGDKNTHSPEMDYELVEKAITSKTKAIILVDYGGLVCDYDKVYEIAERNKHLFIPCETDGSPLGDLSARIQKGLGRISILSDCAHSLGASRVVQYCGTGKRSKPENRYCGRIADFSSFSFHAVKNFTTAEGGASTWYLPDSVYEQGVTDEELYHTYQLLSLHGQNKDAFAKTQAGAWEYDIIGPWYKCNMTDITAAIGLRQLDRYPSLLKHRERIIRKYDERCDELGLLHLNHHIQGMDSSNHLYIIRIPDITEMTRNEVIRKLAEAGIATNVHYKPLPLMSAYGKDGSNCPNAIDYYHNLITLPLHTLLTDEDVEYICKNVKKVITELKEN